MIELSLDISINPMKISIVSVEDGIVAIGFRKIASLLKALHPAAEICYVSPDKNSSLYSHLIRGGGSHNSMDRNNCQLIAEYLSKSEMVCFSSMTTHSALTIQIIRAIRAINSSVYIVWGGIHPIVCPCDAIKYADAICVGEGETAFQEFLSHYQRGTDYTKVRNFWFKENQ